MKIISWNVNGIRSVVSKNFINSIIKISPDIICLQEIKATIDKIPQELFELKGYSVIANSALRPGYSGTLVLSKIKPFKISKSIGLERFDSEGRFLRLDYDDFILINTYIPNGARDKKDFDYKFLAYDKITEYIKSLGVEKKIILVGDLNVAHTELDLARPKENVNNTMFTFEERQKLGKVLSLGFIDTFRMFEKNNGFYSWWAYSKDLRERNIGWRIDYIFVTEVLRTKIEKAYILKDILGSDHCPVGIDIQV